MTDHGTHYFTVWNVCDALDGTRANDGRNASGIDNDERTHWAGADLATAREYARHGWEEGAALIGSRLPEFHVEEVPAFEYLLAEEGSEPDVGAFLAGEELCMGDMRRVPVAKPVVTIGVDMSVSANVSAAQMMRVGQSVFAVVERLRAMGYPTAVDAVFAVKARNGDRIELRLNVQTTDQPVHGGLLAFYVAHPSSLRRAMFALAETLPTHVRDTFRFHSGGGYGSLDVGRSKADYDEWAPSAMTSEEGVAAWVADVIARRTEER
jgi:hypothetical protein